MGYLGLLGNLGGGGSSFSPVVLGEAGVTFDNSFFDNSFFDNYFDFLRQLKNGSFLGPVFVHVTGRSKN